MATVMERIVVVMVKRDHVPSRAIVMETMEQAPPTNQVPGRTGQGARQIIIMEGEKERMFQDSECCSFSFMFSLSPSYTHTHYSHGEHGHAHHGSEGGGAGDGSGSGSGEGSRRYCPCCYCELFGHNGVGLYHFTTCFLKRKSSKFWL